MLYLNSWEECRPFFFVDLVFFEELPYAGEVIEKDGNNPQGLTARNRIATAKLRAGKADEAAVLVEEVIAKNPRDADALVMRAELALAKGDTNAAITDLRAVLRDQPNSVPILRALARAHLAANEAALAEEALRASEQQLQAILDSARYAIPKNILDGYAEITIEFLDRWVTQIIEFFRVLFS